MKPLLTIFFFLLAVSVFAQEIFPDTLPGNITSLELVVNEVPDNNPYAERDSSGVPTPLRVINGTATLSGYNHIKGVYVKVGTSIGSADIIEKTFLFTQTASPGDGTGYITDMDKVYLTLGAYKHQGNYYLQAQLILDDDSMGDSATANAE